MRQIYSVVAMGILVFFVLLNGVSWAENPGRHSKVLLSSQLSGRVLPTEGASEDIELSYRYYYSGSDNILFRNNHIGFGVADSISPATNSVGAFVVIEPLAVFNLRVQYDYLQYFGAFSAMLIFPTADSDYSDGVLDDLQDDNEAIWGTGQRLSVIPTFQVMYSRFVALNTARFEWYDMNKDYYFYEPAEDILMDTEEYFFANESVLGFIFWKRSDNNLMFVGSRYVYMSTENSNKQRQELDGVFVWMMGDKVWFMENPMLMAAAGGYLEDRYREDDVFLGMMFRFDYTLLSTAKN